MCKRLLFYFGFCAALALFASACRTDQRQTVEAARHLPDADPIEDSGRHLAGDFIVESFTDDYKTNSLQVAPYLAFSFKDDSSFRSERPSRGSVRIETGSYIISARSELVLYIETVGGEALTDAIIEHFKIEEENATMLKLRRSGSATLALRKK